MHPTPAAGSEGGQACSVILCLFCHAVGGSVRQGLRSRSSSRYIGPMRSVFCTILTLGLLTAAAPVAAQSSGDLSPEGVQAVIDQLFDGMRAGDSTMVRETFHLEARLQSAFVRDGQPMLQTGSVDGFVEAVGSPHDEVWDEKIWDVEIAVDGHLAQAWMNYAFFLGETFSHCGVNAFHFHHDGAAWKITQITDTRRREGCEVE